MEDKMDPQQLLVNLAVLTVLFIVWWEASKFLFKRFKRDFNKVRDVLARSKAFRKKQKEVEDMKARGEVHEWVTISIPGLGGNMMVCRKTGYVPSKKGFLPIEVIQRHEKTQAFEKKIQKEYDEFKNERFSSISKDYDIPMEKMEDLMDKICSIYNDFHNQRFKQELKRIQNAAKGLANARSTDRGK